MKEIKLNDIYNDIRYLNSYQLERMSRLRELKWATGVTKLPGSIEDSLSPNEQTWYRNNTNAIKKYLAKSEIKGLDLNSDLEPPSTSNVITVKCNESLGQVMLSNGVSVTFEENCIYSFPRNVVEKYVRLGQLEVV